MWTFAFKTFWWEIRLLGKIEVGQTVADRGERESLPAILTSNHPVRHTNLARALVWFTVLMVGILGMMY